MKTKIKKYDLVLFDLDGTLLDTSPGIISALKNTLDYLDLPKIADEKLLEFIGPPKGDFFMEEYNMPREKALEAHKKYHEFSAKQSLFQAEIYDYIPQLLIYLKSNNYLTAVATNKNHRHTMKILSHFGLAKYFDVINGADDAGTLKKIDTILKCLLQLNINCDHKNTVLIGDSSYDAIGSKKAGIDFIGVTYGYGFKNINEIHEYEHVGYVETAKQLFDFF